MNRRALVASFALLAVAILPAQAVNDRCATASTIAPGVTIVASNAGAMAGPDPVACNATTDVWFTFVAPCNAQYLASTCAAATNFDTVVSVWTGSCAGLAPVGCNDNNCPLGGPVTASRVTFTGVAGATYYVSVGGKFGGTGTFSITVSVAFVTTLAFTTVGPGTLGYTVSGPPNGAYFIVITTNAGAFPFGWFYGVDVALFEIAAQFNAGPPFIGVLSPCGTAAFGPVGGAPSGLTLYAVALVFAPGSTTPTGATNPATITVP